MCSLGDVVILSHIRIQTSDTDAANAERQERLLMLFPGVLLLLSVTARVSGYIYKVGITAAVESVDISTRSVTAQLSSQWIYLQGR